MQKMHEQGCAGCPVELVDQQISLRGFLDQCPLDATEFKKRRKWERAIVRGGNCALNQTVVKPETLVTKDAITGVDE